MAEVTAKGDAGRGERIFRRADIGCLKCHSVSKAGGNVGPELSAVGGSSPLDYVIQSILDPSASIKEQYLTKVITTNSGKTVTGIVMERNNNTVVLKDATGKLLKVAVADIDDEKPGKSLMPEGVTQPLTHSELLDLMKFVAELGKPGPYGIRTVTNLQRWKRLREVPAALREGVPNRDVIRDTVLRAGPEAWDTVYALVNGTLPLEELHKPGQTGPIYLQGEVDVKKMGDILVRVKSTEPTTTVWIDEEVYEKPSAIPVKLSPGRHKITVRVVVGESKVWGLEVDFDKPANSTVVFDIVHGD
jgi:putative heme-binding domain-containing protein